MGNTLTHEGISKEDAEKALAVLRWGADIPTHTPLECLAKAVCILGVGVMQSVIEEYYSEDADERSSTLSTGPGAY